MKTKQEEEAKRREGRRVMRRHPADPKAREKYEAANTKGAETFGTLWLAATQEVVAMFRDFGFGDEIERNYGLRAAVASGIYKTLALATRHPVNLSRGADRILAGEPAHGGVTTPSR